MKKYLLLSFLFISTFIFAQVPEDAIRYSFYPQTGTARNMAIGGAMGSLGGDINATFVNPAGLGFYKTNEFVITPGFFLNNNRAKYRDTDSKNSRNSLGFGTSGWVFGHSDRNNPQSSSAFSLAITQTANFNNEIRYTGLNNFSSFSEMFAEEFAKSGLSIDEALSSNSPFPYTSAPALYTYLIDTVSVGGNIQVKGAPEYILDAGQALRQEMIKKTKGAISEIAVGFAHNSKDKWFIGGTIGIPLVSYSSNTVFKESDTSANTSNYFKRFEYTDDFTTKGMGVNLKLGIIYRPQDYIRLGLAIHTPTWMFLTDTRTSFLTTEVENPVDNFSVSSQTFTNNQPGKANYIQSTPLKAIISGSYVFREISDVTKQKGFISADIEYVHHKGSRFSSDNEEVTAEEKAYYKALNRVVKADYKGNFNFRLGGELKFNIIMARLGFAYYGNPYKDAAYKASRMLLSGGLGYRNKGFFIDLSYIHAMSKDVSFPYRLEDRANTYAMLKQTRGNVVATVGVKF
ncbi:MAG: aromatic hydrocarbon degradation protein [Chitinophagaceae bacterium]|nr:aromatic hydrocarbon degradation protein [Chitinophagaceae bacterium]MBK9533391.1 aromatic hydrocarbon degradation protein [Chitinophagaceae bacterium]